MGERKGIWGCEFRRVEMEIRDQAPGVAKMEGGGEKRVKYAEIDLYIISSSESQSSTPLF